MSKLITRTITTFTYTTGTFNTATLQIENVQTHSFTYKLGARDRRKLEEENATILAETTSKELYGMPLDTFIKYAEKVNKEVENDG